MEGSPAGCQAPSRSENIQRMEKQFLPSRLLLVRLSLATRQSMTCPLPDPNQCSFPLLPSFETPAAASIPASTPGGAASKVHRFGDRVAAQCVGAQLT